MSVVSYGEVGDRMKITKLMLYPTLSRDQDSSPLAMSMAGDFRAQGNRLRAT